MWESQREIHVTCKAAQFSDTPGMEKLCSCIHTQLCISINLWSSEILPNASDFKDNNALTFPSQIATCTLDTLCFMHYSCTLLFITQRTFVQILL